MAKSPSKPPLKKPAGKGSPAKPSVAARPAPIVVPKQRSGGNPEKTPLTAPGKPRGTK
ncbi:MAG: hypothetical protein AB7O56_00120 [Bauldia sp.]